MGNLLSRLLVPNTKNSNLPSSKAAIHSENQLYSLYYLQAGAFINRNNANSLKISLAENNTIATIVEKDGICKVIIEVSFEKEKLNKRKEELYEKGFYCLINQFEIHDPTKSEDSLYKVFEKALNIIRFQISFNNLKASVSLTEMESYTNLIEEFTHEFSGLLFQNNTKTSEEFLNNYKALINLYNKSLNNKDQEGCTTAIINEILLISKYQR